MFSTRNHPIGDVPESPQAEEYSQLTDSNNAQSADRVKSAGQSRRFQKPYISELLLYLLCCGLAYPLLYAITLAAQGRSLFAVRMFVGLGCAIAAISLCYFLQRFSTRFLEAAVWSTLVQQSYGNVSGRMTLNELSSVSGYGDPFAIYRIWRIRRRIRLSLGRNQSYGWSHQFAYPVYLMFLLLFIIAQVLNFTLGRIVDVTAGLIFDHGSYTEVGVFGDIGPMDIGESQTHGSGGAGSAPLIITGERESLPPTWRYNAPGHVSVEMNGQSVYFTTPYPGQLRSDGIGIGGKDAWAKVDLLSPRFDRVENFASTGKDHPSLLRYPQWGVRTSCRLLPDIKENVYASLYRLADENTTQIRVPFEFVSELHSFLNKTFEKIPQNPDLMPDIRHPIGDSYPIPNVESLTDGTLLVSYNWTNFANIQRSNRLPNCNLVGFLTDDGRSGDGWTTFDLMMARTYFTCRPNETAVDCLGPIYESPDAAVFTPSTLFTDYEFYVHEVIACVQRTEAWILEVQNSTRVAVATGVFAKDNGVRGAELSRRQYSGIRNKVKVSNPTTFTYSLNSTYKSGAFRKLYDFTTDEWISNSGVEYNGKVQYQSWIDGQDGALSEELFENFRSIISSRTMLSKLAGSMQVLAHQYRGRLAAFAHIQPIPMIALLVLLSLLGVIGCLFVPVLPDGFPDRKFDVYSWMASVKGDELVVEEARDDGVVTGREVAWRSRMKLEDIKEELGKKRIRFRA